MTDAAALGRTFRELFGAFSAAEGLVEALLEACLPYALVYVFVRDSARMPFRRPHLSLSAKDYPKSSADPAWQQYWALSSRPVPNHRAVDAYCLLQGTVERNELSGALYAGYGYVYQYVARAQALCQLLVQVWSLLTLSRRNRGVLTEMAASASSGCSPGMVAGSRPLTTYEEPSDDPWRYNTDLDNVAGLVVFGIVVNLDGGPAPRLCVRLGGCVPGRGESFLLSPSDACPWCRCDGRFVVR